MNLITNLKGRLRNTSLPKSHGLMPVFEAVVNSIHSIEEKESFGENGKIVVKIIRVKQSDLAEDDSHQEPISGFEISDNGCGFNEENLSSFKTLDTDYKIELGCRGVGRLMWLKAFDSIDVASTYLNQAGDMSHVAFSFDETKGVHREKQSSSKESETNTKIALQGFDKKYLKSVPRSLHAVATQLLRHCLWYFVRDGGAPDILVRDGMESVSVQSLYDEYMHANAQHETIDIGDHTFELTHIKFTVLGNDKHQLALCAANRLVKEESLQGKIPGLFGKLSDDEGEFFYTCYVSSTYLDENTRSERTSFTLEEDWGDGIFAESEISLKDIKEQVVVRSKAYLKEFIEQNVSASRERLKTFIDGKAPRYRPIEKYVPDEDLFIDPAISDLDLELHLHEHWYRVERDLLEDGQDVMDQLTDEIQEEYESRVQEYLERVNDLKKSDLANYVFHRKVIIELLSKSIEILKNGKYEVEDRIHELLMPMRTDSESELADSCNLWLLDERLAFHSYLASDKPLKSMPVTNSASGKEPDLISVSIFDNPICVRSGTQFPLASVTVVEIKRPMRNDMKEGEDKDPLDQALGYLERIREGSVQTPAGRLIPGSDNIPGYCYVLCDLTEKMIKRCKSASLQVTSDGMGYFGYNPNYKAYIEVISFDQLVRSATERNSAFFEKLGLPVS